MKLAVAFLLVAFTSQLDFSSAAINNPCLTKLLETDAPQFVQDLGNLLCKYQLAKATQNQALFLEFLNGVNQLLEGVGCSLDSLLGTNVVPTIKNCEPIADDVAKILFDVLNTVLASVTEVMKALPSLLTDIVDRLVPEVGVVLEVLEHLGDVKDVACDVLEDILPTVANILKLGGDIVNHILSDLGVKERTPIRT